MFAELFLIAVLSLLAAVLSLIFRRLLKLSVTVSKVILDLGFITNMLSPLARIVACK